ncbi:hypothetical protein D3C87_1872810 [compost metagenome]
MTVSEKANVVKAEAVSKKAETVVMVAAALEETAVPTAMHHVASVAKVAVMVANVVNRLPRLV